MNWVVTYLKEAAEDLQKLDNSQRIEVLKGIKKVSQNPLPQSQGGYGKPLGNHNGVNLTGLLKIKYKNLGIRVVYKVEIVQSEMIIVVISIRDDEEVYQLANKRRVENDL